MGETRVVWLITQRSRVQIPPPLPRPEALSRTEQDISADGESLGAKPGTKARRPLAVMHTHLAEVMTKTGLVP